MFFTRLHTFILALAAVLLALASYHERAMAMEPAPSRHALESISKRPLTFENNQGQAPSSFQFVSRTPTFTALFKGNAVLFSLPERAISQPSKLTQQKPQRSPKVVEMDFCGGSEQAAPVTSGYVSGQSNYFLGKNAKQWLTGISQYSKVTYTSVYPNIDVAYYGSAQSLEYDLLIAPSGDPGRIRLKFKGADRLQIDAAGNLVLHTGNGVLLLNTPLAYQKRAGSTQSVEARFIKVSKNEVNIRVGQYDQTSTLIIDPKLSYSTYLGGADDEGIFGIAFDPEGNLYVAGETSSLNFPVRNAAQATVGGSYDAFVSKFDRTGSKLIYSTYLGGSGYDHAVGLAVDANGSAYVAGITQSPDFPLKQALQTELRGTGDAFMTRLSSAGSALVYSTYLGGAGDDAANGIAIDVAGNAFVTGNTQSLDFPVTTNAFQPHCGGSATGFCSGDGFVTEFNPSGSRLLYSTFLGGSAAEFPSAVAVDDQGSIYVVGQTQSQDFPVKNAYQQTLAGPANAFITKLSPSSKGLEYSTYLGGNSFDGAQDIAVDADRNMYVTGFTSSTNFPTASPFQGALAGQIDAFVSKVRADGSRLEYSTYLGGSQIDYPFRIALDAAGNASIIGFTYSADYPVANALEPTYLGGVSDAFVSRLNATGSALTFSSFLGGASDDYGYAISTDLTGALWVAGSTSSKDLALRQPYQKQYGGGPYDAFLEKISLDPGEALDVLHAAIGNFVLSSQLNQAAAVPLQYEVKVAAEATRAGNRLLADLALIAFEASVLDDFERGFIPGTVALRLGVAGYDILSQIA